MFRDPKLAKALVRAIHKEAREIDRTVNLMEVCGTHTMAIAQFGIRAMMPENVRLLSGPGCPVCVTVAGYVDAACQLAQRDDVLVATFGDMVRVPGTNRISLDSVGNHQVVYSAADTIPLARRTSKTVVFLAVGFETTAPTIAATIISAKKQNIKNLLFLVAHKTIPPAMAALLSSPNTHIDAFICPGHVSAIIGAKPYETIAEKFHRPCVITGFEALDVLEGILMILRQLRRGEAKVETQYRRVVRYEGNQKALAVMREVFEECDADWRGIGRIAKSGLRLREEFADFDAERVLGVRIERGKPDPRCRCGQIMQGLCLPPDCPLFAEQCRPEHPVGPCMVSSEGACAAFFKHPPTLKQFDLT